jgi:hypothetical protein
MSTPDEITIPDLYDLCCEWPATVRKYRREVCFHCWRAAYFFSVIKLVMRPKFSFSCGGMSLGKRSPKCYS